MNSESPQSASQVDDRTVKSEETQIHACPHCRKPFRDLKAHLLTHGEQRPEKCPFKTCPYHVKGFSRKYDRNRHTLNHYRGELICSYCPGLGSVAEVSFHRVDQFKKHLLEVHKVQPKPPNGFRVTSSGRRPVGLVGDSVGVCNVCRQTCADPGDFFDHLDDCILLALKPRDPAEDINARNLASIMDDEDLQETLKKHNLIAAEQTTTPTDGVSEGAGNGPESNADDAHQQGQPDDSQVSTQKQPMSALVPGGRKRMSRRHYPSSWGFNESQMTFKKRVAAVFSGPERLDKQEMMISTDHEVRLRLSDGRSSVTDLDVLTLHRAETVMAEADGRMELDMTEAVAAEQLDEIQRMLQGEGSSHQEY